MKRLLPGISIFLFLFFLVSHLFAQTDQTVNSGSNTTAVNFPAGGCVYNWVNDNPSIGLAASGTGNIASFKPVNNGNMPVTANISATPVGAGFAFITNNIDFTVSVINTSTNTIVHTIPVMQNPIGVAISPDGSRLYIANSVSNSVSVINTATDVVIASIIVNTNPWCVLVSPDGKKLYVASQYYSSQNTNSIDVINTSTNVVESSITVGQLPFEVVQSQDGKFLYISSQYSNNISVINAQTNSTISTISLGVTPQGLVLSPDGTLLYVAIPYQDEVLVINTNSGTIISSIPVGNRPEVLAINSDGSRVYVTNQISNNVTVINTATKEIITNIPVGKYPFGISFSTNGLIYVTNQGSNSVSIINAVTNTVVNTIAVGADPETLGNFVTGCQPVTFSITVDPPSLAPPSITTTTATGTISACAGTPSASLAIQQFTVSGTGLTGNIIATAPVGFEVSLSATGNYGSALTISQLNNATNAVVYVRSSSSALPGDISGNVVLTSAGATSQNVSVTGIVHALPTVNPVVDQTVANGSATTPINFTGTGNPLYTWTNDMPGIGLPASGAGSIAPFIAVNTGTIPLIATLTATPITAGFAYVSNYGSNTVSVINTANHSVSATIPVGNSPEGVSVSPDGSIVYVANELSNSVSVINTASNTTVATVSVGTFPTAVSVTSDGRYVYVSNVVDGTVSVISTITNTVTATIPGFNQPYFLAVNPSANLLYVANSPLGTVSVVNTITNAIEKTITVGADPIQIVIRPDGSQVYVANQSGNSVSVINTATNTVTATIPIGNKPYGEALSPDGNFLYVSCPRNGSVAVINTNTDQVIKVINIGYSPVGISVTSDGRYVYVVSDDSPGKVSIIDAATNLVIATVPVGVYPNSLGNFISPGTGCTGTPVQFKITVNPTPPTITVNGDISSLTSVYGTPSASGSFMVSGLSLPAGILVTPPPGFEVSTDNINFSNTVTVGTPGNTPLTLVYIRLAAVTAVGIYSGNVVLSSGTVTPVYAAVPNSKVTPAPLTITASNAGKFFGTVLTNTSGAIYYTTSGLQNSDQVNSVDVSYGNGAAANAAPGTYPGSVTITNATGNPFDQNNYVITYIPGDIDVYDVPVTGITIAGDLSPLTTVYGTPSSSISFTVSATNLTAGILITPPAGFEVSADNNTFSGTVVVSTSGMLSPTLVYIRIAATSVVGKYSGNIVLTSPGVTAGILIMPVSTVTPALLTISADAQIKTYGTPNPPLTVTYSGFVDSDGPAQLTYQPLVTTTATITSPYGQYLITASGAASPNYTFIYIPGYLSVVPSSQAIVIPNAFTPNGDGINDVWNIKYLDYYPDCTVSIFTRYGETIYQSVSYPVPWDGRFKGAELPTGVYYYIINLKNGSGLLSGNVTIIR